MTDIAPTFRLQSRLAPSVETWTAFKSFLEGGVGAELTGAVAWWLWSLVHVALLVDTRSRISGMFDWFWSYLTCNCSVRLITGGEREA